jgi:N-ethylmaleimide reductase
LHIVNPALEQMQSGKEPDLRALDMVSTIRRRYKGTLVVAAALRPIPQRTGFAQAWRT